MVLSNETFICIICNSSVHISSFAWDETQNSFASNNNRQRISCEIFYLIIAFNLSVVYTLYLKICVSDISEKRTKEKKKWRKMWQIYSFKEFFVLWWKFVFFFSVLSGRFQTKASYLYVNNLIGYKTAGTGRVVNIKLGIL